MMTGLRDYVAKAGLGARVLLGRSGGDRYPPWSRLSRSTPLGPDNVRCVMLPSRSPSAHLARRCGDVARRLGTRLDTVPIGAAHDAVLDTLAPLFAGDTSRT